MACARPRTPTPTRRPPTPTASGWSSATCRRWPTTDFSPTFLRNATAFGASPRIRFDIVLNNLAGLAWTTGRITMTSDGMPWRPLVHVRDICRPIAATLEAPREAVARPDPECRRQRQQLSHPRDRRGDRRGLPQLHDRVRQTTPATTAATGCASTRSGRSCRASAASGRARKGAGRCAACSCTSTWSEREFNARALHPAAPAAAPARDPTDRPGLLLAAP